MLPRLAHWICRALFSQRAQWRAARHSHNKNTWFVILSLCKRRKSTPPVILSEWNERPNGLQGTSRSKKNPQNLRYTLILWILRFLIESSVWQCKEFLDTSPKALYVGLALLNFLFLMIFGYNATTNDDGLLLKILQFLLCFFITVGILCSLSIGFGFALRCYTITGYKSIWLFIIAFFIPQIFCAVCSLIYFFS